MNDLFGVEVLISEIDSPTLTLLLDWMVVVGIVDDGRQVSGNLLRIMVRPPASHEDDSSDWASVAATKLQNRGIIARKIRLEGARHAS